MQGLPTEYDSYDVRLLSTPTKNGWPLKHRVDSNRTVTSDNVDNTRQVSQRETAVLRKYRQDGKVHGAFVHIGKTGGSTLSILLRDGCHSFMDHPCRVVENESVASFRISSYYHVPDFGLLPDSKNEFYVVSVRDPFDRTVSAFAFEHVLNRLARNETIDEWKIEKYVEAYRCFPTLESFVTHLGYTPRKFDYPFSRRSVHAESCPDLARAALYGRVKLYNHLFFSFDRIRTMIPTNKTGALYATRQEHLWEDWRSLNRALGQTEGTLQIPLGSQQRNSTTMERKLNLPVKRALSPTGRMILCNALREEYRAYFWFLLQARNLNEVDIQNTVKEAQSKCPIIPMQEMLKRASPFS